jgi:hypothetical protein
MRPQARTTGIVVDEVEGEVVVYDLGRNAAHCLKGVTSLVWRYADGQTTVETLIERLREGSAHDVTEDAVWSALESLSQANLLIEPVAGPSLAFIQSRRDALRRAAVLGAITVGAAITSVLAPAASREELSTEGAEHAGQDQHGDTEVH